MNSFSLPVDNFYDDNCTYTSLQISNIIELGQLFNEFIYFKNMTKCDKLNYISEVEHGCYKKAVEISIQNRVDNDFKDSIFQNIYRLVSSKVLYNIQHNNEFINLINSQEYAPEKFGFLTFKELAPVKYEKIKKLSKYEYEGKVKYSNMYVCKKCKEKKCTIKKVINRSLDEGTNFMITCGECGHFWYG